MSTVEELETVIEAGIEAVQILLNNRDSGDFKRSLSELEDWATQAADWLPDDDWDATGRGPEPMLDRP